MPKYVYCSNCGTRLEITRKALKGYGRIIDLINPHVCPDEPVDLDLSPSEVPVRKEVEGKFVEKLNDLRQPPQVSTLDLRDKRKESEVKTTAPASIIEQMKSAVPSVPVNELGGEPEGSE